MDKNIRFLPITSKALDNKNATLPFASQRFLFSPKPPFKACHCIVFYFYEMEHESLHSTSEGAVWRFAPSERIGRQLCPMSHPIENSRKCVRELQSEFDGMAAATNIVFKHLPYGMRIRFGDASWRTPLFLSIYSTNSIECKFHCVRLPFYIVPCSLNLNGVWCLVTGRRVCSN